MLDTLLAVGAGATAVVAIIALLVIIHRLFKRLDVIGEGVLGKPEVLDYSGAIIEPAVPSIQARVSSLETLMRNNNQESRLSQLEAWRDEHTRESDAVVTKMLDHIVHHPGNQ